MNPYILSELFRIYFDRHPTQAVTDDQLGETKGFSPEMVADSRWYKEKLIIERTKEALENWLSSVDENTDLETLAQIMPEFDIRPALDSDLREWAIRVVNFISSPLQSAKDSRTMVFKPLLSNAYSLTFHRSGSFGPEEAIDDNDLTFPDFKVPDESSPLPHMKQRTKTGMKQRTKTVMKRTKTEGPALTGSRCDAVANVIKSKEGERSSLRKRVAAYHGEVETLGERKAQKELSG